MAGISRRAVVAVVLVGVVTVAVGAVLLNGRTGAEPEPVAPSTAGGSEALETRDGSVERLPLPDVGEPLIAAPLPESGFATGEFVDGFPERVLPLAPGSDLTSSSLAVEGSVVQAGLIAMSTDSAEQIHDFYRSAFAALELNERESGAVPGSTALVFTREANAITLTVTERDGGVDYTLVAILTAE